MRVALVSPYSWTYPGGVTRHIESLAGELARAGHDVRVLAPYDPDDRRAAILHRGTRPQPRPIPEWLVPLGGTIGWAFNGAVSNLAGTPSTISTLRRELRAGRFDVVHLHEPVAPVVGWDALTSADAPLVGTFHCYSENVPPHLVGGAPRCPAQAQPPRGADRRLRGRRVDRAALLRRRVPGRAQRRRAARGRRAGAARGAARATRWRSCSSARPSSARACRCSCAPSRRCTSTFRRGSRSSARPSPRSPRSWSTAAASPCSAA